MKNTTKPFFAGPLALACLCMPVWFMPSALAEQTKRPSAKTSPKTNTSPTLPAAASAVQLERSRTRALIEQVTSDQKSDLDDATSLGQTLRHPVPSQPQALRREPQVRRQVARPGDASDALQSTAGATSLLGTPQIVPRPAPKSLADRGKAPVFTPDFSRQRLTLSGIAGKADVDLPNQEVGLSTDPAASQANSTSPVQVAVAVAVETEANVKAKAKADSQGVPLTQALGLADLVSLGLGYSPVMEQVLAQLDVALSRSQQSRAELFPRASLRYALGPEESQSAAGRDFHRSASSTLRLTQPVVNLPLIRDWMSDLNAHEAAEWRVQAARESVALAVTNATIQLATSRLVLDFSDDQLKAFNELLAYVQARTEAGAASMADLERTRTRVLLARQIRIEQQAAYRNALLEVERLLGQVPAALQLPTLNLLPGLPATQAELRQLVRDYSYELRALRADVEAQKNSVSSQYGKLYPVLGLSLERDETINIRGTNPRQIDNRLLAVMTWDISLGGKEIYAARGAQAELGNRLARLAEETDRTLQAADADFALLQSASLRVAAGEAEQKASMAVVVALREQLRTGRIGSLLEALDAFERHFAARQRLTQTIGQQMQAQAQLLRRLGLLSSLDASATVALAPKPAIDVSEEK